MSFHNRMSVDFKMFPVCNARIRPFARKLFLNFTLRGFITGERRKKIEKGRGRGGGRRRMRNY